MSSAEIKVYATWDEEAQVWWARSDDIAGLATEAATMEDMHRKLSIIIGNRAVGVVPCVGQESDICAFLLKSH